MLSVEELEAALPAMTPWRVPGGRAVDWGVLHARLGTALPSDFRALAEAYPVLVVDDFLMVALPSPGAEERWRPGVATTRSFRICTRWTTPRATFPSRNPVA